MNKKDLYIQAKLQQDKKISKQVNEVFEKFEGGINLENNNKPKEKRVLRISLRQAVLAFSSLMIVVILGGNLYAHMNGKPNLYSAIKSLFIKEAKYTQSEVAVDQTVESNGIKLTLKTVAMDENVLITKYVAEGEKLKNEFYTYSEFEEDMIDIAKKYFAARKFDIGEEAYKNVKQSEPIEKYSQVREKLIRKGLKDIEATRLADIGYAAYKEYIGAELGGLEGTTIEKAKEQIEKAIVEFEAKITSKYTIMESNDTLQNIGILAVSQKIEKEGNGYIIYNIYNVDTITDLASKFNLIIKINKIGKIQGKWNFETKLEKARLDTRVETIEFYENNSYNNVAPTITADEVRHAATVEVKKIVISDFSTVLMVQTKIKEEDRGHYLKYADNGIPCIFVVTNEKGDIVGRGTTTEDTYEYICAGGGEIKYTDRIILENIDKDTKKLYVKIYEPYYIAEGDTVELNNKTIELDIEKARNSKKPVELTQNYVSKNVQVAFKYPVDWKVVEEESRLYITGPEDVDGKYVEMYISLSQEEQNAKEIFELKKNDFDKTNLKATTGIKNIAGIEGYYYTIENIDNKIGTRILFNKENKLYNIEYIAVPAQYERHKDTIEKILATIEFVEPEKSYRTFSSGRHEIVKLYEDNTLSISFTKKGIELLKFETDRLESDKEYKIVGLPEGFEVQNVKILSITDSCYSLPGVFITIWKEGIGSRLYYVDLNKARNNGIFEVYNKYILKNIVTEVEYANSEVYNFYKDEYFTSWGGELIIFQARTEDGKIYAWNYSSPEDIIVAEYIPQQQEKPQETPNSKYENMLYKSFKIYNGEVKQYEDNTVTVKWNDEINTHKSKLWAVKPNIEYTITGLDSPIKEVYNIIGDRQEECMPTIKILTENGTLYGNLELKADTNELKTSLSGGGVIHDIETVLPQQSAEKIVLITKADKAYIVLYVGGAFPRKAPSKQTIYNCVQEYCNSSDKLALNEPIENAFEFITYIEDGEIAYKADARIKIYDSSISKVKTMKAIVVYDTQNNNFRVETFDENPRGGGGY